MKRTGPRRDSVRSTDPTHRPDFTERGSPGSSSKKRRPNFSRCGWFETPSSPRPGLPISKAARPADPLGSQGCYQQGTHITDWDSSPQSSLPPAIDVLFPDCPSARTQRSDISHTHAELISKEDRCPRLLATSQTHHPCLGFSHTALHKRDFVATQN